MQRSFIILVTVLCVAVLAVGLGLSSTAAQNGTPLPTATFHPNDGFAFELTQVRGEGQPWTFPASNTDTITLGETTVVADYPNGITFTTNLETDGTVRRFDFLQVFDDIVFNRIEVDYDDPANISISLFDLDVGQAPWTPVSFGWEVATDEGDTLTTDVYTIIYEDTTADWYRLETEPMIIYFTEFATIETDDAVAMMVEAIGSTYARLTAVYGNTLPFQVTQVIHPTRAGYQFAGHSDLLASLLPGAATRAYATIDTHIEYDYLADACFWFNELPDNSEMTQLQVAISRMLTRQLVIETQADNTFGSDRLWWNVGQQRWLLPDTVRDYNDRLIRLAAADYQLGSLADPQANGNTISLFDECGPPAPDVGASFINWMVVNNGLDTLPAVLDAIQSGASVPDAIAEVLGRDFLEIENEWRTSLSYPPILPEDLDPSLALQDPIDPAFNVGDTVTLGGFMGVTIRGNPGDDFGQAQCFPGTEVEIVRVGSLDGENWFEIDCAGLTGWMNTADLGG